MFFVHFILQYYEESVYKPDTDMRDFRWDEDGSITWVDDIYSDNISNIENKDDGGESDKEEYY